MTHNVLDENTLLQNLLNKVILYRFSRNLDKELQIRRISHAELSGSTGRSGNWFNRTFNELEDMRISTFIKSISAINKIISKKENVKPVEIEVILDKELLKIASVSIDLSMNSIEHLLQNDKEITRFFLEEIRYYVDALRAHNCKLSDDEFSAYEQILKKINSEGN